MLTKNKQGDLVNGVLTDVKGSDRSEKHDLCKTKLMRAATIFGLQDIFI